MIVGHGLHMLMTTTRRKSDNNFLQK
jgi:hypothetical protein